MSNTLPLVRPSFLSFGAFSRGGVGAEQDRAGNYQRPDVAGVGVRSGARLHHGASRTACEPITSAVCVRYQSRLPWSALVVRLAPSGAPCATPQNAGDIMVDTYTL